MVHYNYAHITSTDADRWAGSAGEVKQAAMSCSRDFIWGDVDGALMAACHRFFQTSPSLNLFPFPPPPLLFAFPISCPVASFFPTCHPLRIFFLPIRLPAPLSCPIVALYRVSLSSLSSFFHFHSKPRRSVSEGRGYTQAS